MTEEHNHKAGANLSTILTLDRSVPYPDGENRVKSFARRSGVAGPNTSVQCGSDYIGRRISKTVSNVTSTVNYFIYDGWNLIAILGVDGSLLYSFNWGPDGSGTEHGAGGVGGLISITIHSGANAGTYFYSYEGNYNVAALVNAPTGEIAAQYEYGPFGELRRATGPLAQINQFLFSTKLLDPELGLYDYGFRYYRPQSGSWLSRDPLFEEGGLNLYAFLGGSPVSKSDLLGLCNCIVSDFTVTFNKLAILNGPRIVLVKFDINPGRPSLATLCPISTMSQMVPMMLTMNRRLHVSTSARIRPARPTTSMSAIFLMSR